ncbi:hypothetical protein WJX81_000976 [Elliptochloris bilobata]|uniref:Cysteine dioxygenase n=1 Tax=Elliptochloris bilobata TaxID=381761 RepID=A0AAW1RC84_9CHLO
MDEQPAIKQEEVAWAGRFPMVRGGVATFTLQPLAPFMISVRAEATMSPRGTSPAAVVSAAGGSDWIGVRVGLAGADLVMCRGGTTQVLSRSPGAKAGYVENRRLSFWLSFDPDAQTVKYGKGHHMEESTLLQHTFTCGKTCSLSARREMDALFGPEPKLVALHGAPGPVVVRCAFQAKLGELVGDKSATVEFDRLPLIANLPPLVLDCSRLTLLDLGRRDFMYATNLPPAAQVLYQHLSQPHIDLNWAPDGPDFKLTDAIRHSLRTPGALLHTRLQAKAESVFPGPESGLAKAGSVFRGAPPTQSYLRVSVGVAQGRSPGIPFVLEIWPAGHNSPIHNHGNAYGIVRVLHGDITARIYNKHLDALCDHEPLCQMVLRSGDMTWFDPNWYQTHQLENHTDDFCCTIQGFQYGEEDSIHWPYMQYKGAQERIHHFLPVSDFVFADMRAALVAEYSAHLAAGSDPNPNPAIQPAAATTAAAPSMQPNFNSNPIAARSAESCGARALGVAPAAVNLTACTGDAAQAAVNLTACAGDVPHGALMRQLSPSTPLAVSNDLVMSAAACAGKFFEEFPSEIMYYI